MPNPRLSVLMANTAHTTARLTAVRRQIDRLDERILQAVNRRARLALAIGRIKKQRKWPVFDSARERFVLRHVVSVNCGPLSQSAVRHVFQSILCECRRRERRHSKSR